MPGPVTSVRGTSVWCLAETLHIGDMKISGIQPGTGCCHLHLVQEGILCKSEDTMAYGSRGPLVLAGVHTVGWLEGEDPGERKKGEVGQGDQSLFIHFSNLPGAETSAEGSVTPETFPWPGSTVCAKSYYHCGHMPS